VAKRHQKIGTKTNRIAQLRTPPKIIPGLGVDLPELQRARALWGLNRFDEALELFDQAVRRYPQNLVALVDAARAFGARFEIQRAEEVLDRLIKTSSNRPDLLHLAGQSYRMIFRPDKAIECFQRVVAATHEIPDAYLELAIQYERRHRLDEAFGLMDLCLKTAPDYLEAELFKARLLRRLKDESAAEEKFRALATNPQSSPELKAQAWAEIAQMHDRREEYPLAMAAMLKTKAILQERQGQLYQHSEKVMAHLRALVDSLTPAHFQRWRVASQNFPPQNLAVLTGFPRSGTTLLEQVLDSHSGLVSSDEREAFARDIFPAIWLTPATPVPTPEAFDNVPPERLLALRARYLKSMEAALNEPIGGRVHLDKNPTLTVVLPGLLRLFPETRVVLALRDPRDVVISCFMQYLPLNSNSIYFLTLERAAQRYTNDIGFWLKLRDRIASPWLEVRYEDTVAKLETEVRRTLEFLGLPWEPGVLDYRDRLKQKAVASPTYEAVSKPLYTRAIGRWRHYQEFLEPYLGVLEPALKAFGY
jgi:tetratricopeptide (TPR) repeat protein